MVLSTFVGRESELDKLAQILTRGSQKEGRVVFIEGEAGTGKSYLLQAFQDRINLQPNPNKKRFVSVACYEDSSSQNAYQPFVDVLNNLVKASSSKEGLAKLFLSILKETGSDWLNMIPGLGPAIGATVKTATIAGQWLLGSSESKSTGQGDALSNQYVQSIARIAEKYAPLILVIEDAHWVDDASCRLLQRMASKLGTQPLVIIVTYRPSYLTGEHPLLKAKNEVLTKGQADIISLRGLSETEVKDYVVRRFGDPLNPRLASWLVYLCKGNPLFVTQYLSLMEQDKVIKPMDGKYKLDGEIRYVADEWEVSGGLANNTIPDSIEALLDQRIKRLVEEDQEMLQLGAVQGELFMSSVLAGLLDKDESDILRRLRKVIEKHRIISLYTGGDLDKTRTEIYTFEHVLLQQALYNKLSPRERVLYHRDIAEQLAKMIQEDKTPSRKLILDAAHHYDLGQVPEPAAQFYSQAAQSLIADGANPEASEIAKRALRNINQVPEDYALKAQIITQLLSASYARAHGLTGEEEELQFFKLIEAAKEAAGHTDDKGLKAQLKYVEGLYEYTFNGLTQGIACYREALELIQEAKDPIGEYVITYVYGHHLCGENLRAGLELQHKAQEIFQNQVKATYSDIPTNLKKHFFAAQYRIGVGEFDLGNYGLAEKLLSESVEEFRKNQSPDELVWALNFLGQVYLAMGVFEECESVLKEALAIDEAAEVPSNCFAYNFTVLGKLYIEWGRITEAEKPLLRGFEDSLKQQIKWELPLARNYYIELLLHPDYSGHDVAEALHQADINIAETQVSTFYRSLVAALSFKGLAALAQKDIDSAVDCSTEAVTYLQKMGDLPALRTEEILFNHFQVLTAANRPEDAHAYLQQAHQVLQRKADSITNPDHRKSFLERVPISRKIMEAVKAL